MEFQIVLLPRSDYWVWLRACRKYVIAFGAGLTDDPGTAARHMAPRQVITLPSRRDGFPEIGDAVRWFQNHHPGIRLDLVDADTPEAMGDELGRRVAENDRYGTRRRPFYLLWPTDYAVVTQSFGANPQIYRRFGMPGHEGVDFRALTNTNVYACAEGEVYEVHVGRKDHAYGVHIRIQHRDGFKTVYGHLAQALVRKGDSVEAGQLIGRADSTGNSSASHLHMSLKRDGATARKETPYPKDIIDPTPFLVWPAQARPSAHATTKTSPGLEWEAGRCLIGTRRSEAKPLGAEEIEALRVGRAEAVLLDPHVEDETVIGLQSVRPGILLVGRVQAKLEEAAIDVADVFRDLESQVRRLVALGVRDFEMHSEPNLALRGLGRLWDGGTGFGRWFTEVVDHLRPRFPEARFGFPMLCPGDSIQGKRQGLMAFLSEADGAAVQSDWLGVACYWNSPDGIGLPSEGRVYEQYRSLFPDKLLMLTAVAPAGPLLSSSEAARQVSQFLEQIRDVPGIAAAFTGTTAPVAGWEALAWASDSGKPTDLARVVGRRRP